MARSIRARRHALQAQTSRLLAVSCIAWLGLLRTVMIRGLCLRFLDDIGAEAPLNLCSGNFVVAERVPIRSLVDNVTRDPTQLDAVTLPKNVCELLLPLRGKP
jgi:hypothetical protein